ncbi:MAG: hypothetical protein WC845_01675 [Candidatus Staskawiczbacteria bacterium]|jgi:hypothetical protein
MTTSRIKDLSIFSDVDGLLRNEENIMNALQSAIVRKVICFCLGPEGTNISQAAKKWLHRMCITGKSEIILGDTPEICLAKAREINEPGVVAVFWTCAVYSQESQFFFGNPDVLPFVFQEAMPLDEMQLATNSLDFYRRCAQSFCDADIPAGWRIASHPSPQHLVKCLNRRIVLVNSNAVAARECSLGNVELCITTEQAREIYHLHKLHSFGSPIMIFFGGLTQHGAKVVQRAFRTIHD